MKAISKEALMKSIWKASLQIIILKLLPHLLGANELIHLDVQWNIYPLVGKQLTWGCVNGQLIVFNVIHVCMYRHPIM